MMVVWVSKKNNGETVIFDINYSVIGVSGSAGATAGFSTGGVSGVGFGSMPRRQT